MWKLYSFAELKGKIKAGDKVRGVNLHNNLDTFATRTVTQVTGIGLETDDGNRCLFTETFPIELWVPDAEKTWDTLQCGDEVKGKDFKTRKVLGILGEIVFLSLGDHYDYAGGYFTKESLKQEGFTIVQEGQVKKPLEVTMEEVREKFGEDIIIKG